MQAINKLIDELGDGDAEEKNDELHVTKRRKKQCPKLNGVKKDIIQPKNINDIPFNPNTGSFSLVTDNIKSMLDTFSIFPDKSIGVLQINSKGLVINSLHYNRTLSTTCFFPKSFFSKFESKQNVVIYVQLSDMLHKLSTHIKLKSIKLCISNLDHQILFQFYGENPNFPISQLTIKSIEIEDTTLFDYNVRGEVNIQCDSKLIASSLQVMGATFNLSINAIKSCILFESSEILSHSSINVPIPKHMLSDIKKNNADIIDSKIHLNKKSFIGVQKACKVYSNISISLSKENLFVVTFSMENMGPTIIIHISPIFGDDEDDEDDEDED